MKNLYTFMRTRGAKLNVAIAAFAGVLATNAQAAVPAWASTAVTNAQDDGLAFIALIGPAVAAVTIGFVLIKIFKRGANKI